MSHVQSNLENLLRPTEHVLVTIPGRVRHGGMELVRCEAALVNHASGGDEEAALFIFNRSSKHPLQLLHIIPIDNDFRHSLLQTPPSPTTSFFHQSAPPYITLNFSHGADRYELKIAASHSIIVQTLVKELRRLSDISYDSSSSSTLKHTWLGLYPAHTDEQAELDSTPGASSSTLISPVDSTMILNTPLSSLATSLSAASITTTDSFFTIGNTSIDGPSPNPYAPNFCRTSFLRKRLFSREANWSTRQPLRIRLATYNVNDKLPPSGTSELAPVVGNGDEDLLVFGFQEVDLRSQALLISLGSNRAEAWETALLRGLGDKAEEYERLITAQYVGVMTIVLIRKSLVSAVSRVETSEKGIGLLGFGGNKAGVAVRLKIYDHTLTFVNSHLAAFATALERRRTDYATLLRGLTFPRPSGADVVPAFEEFLPQQKDRLISIEESNALFWLGDLNYRIDVEDEKLAALVKWKRWEAILQQDQLKADLASGRSFDGFQEARIDFPPTFKYMIGSTTLDSRRPPAYTDRILYSIPSHPSSSSPLPTPVTPMSPPSVRLQRPSSATKVTVDDYTAHEILWSDHRPVSASATVDVRVIDAEKRKAEFLTVQGELDRLEEEWAPSLEVDSQELDFGAVRYRKSETREVILRNKGRVPAMFSFRAPPGRPICKPFIWPFPSSGTIPQGGELKLTISMFVDERWAERLTLGEEELNDVLVLQVKGGKDTFITLQGTFEASIVGLPLSLLTKIPASIRFMSTSERKALTAGSSVFVSQAEAAQRGGADSIAPAALSDQNQALPLEAQTDIRTGVKPESASTEIAARARKEETEVLEKQGGEGLSASAEHVGPSPDEIDGLGQEVTISQEDQSTKPGDAVNGGLDERSESSHSATVLETSLEHVDGATTKDGATETSPVKAPRTGGENVARPAKVIWRLLEYLMENGAGVEELWSGSIDMQAILDITEILDTASSLPPNQPREVAHTLLHLLVSLPTPLIPIHCQMMCIEASERDGAFAVLEGVEGVHTNVLIGLMSVVRLCTPEAAEKGALLGRLASAVFGPKTVIDGASARKFVRLLLEG